MKTFSNLAAKLFLIGALTGCSALFIWNQNAIAKLVAHNKTLSAARQEVELIKQENQQISRLRELDKEVEKFQENNRDLPKLRSDVHQLRERAKEWKSLSRENERLRILKKDSAAASVVVPPDFLPRSALRDVGFASPEAALQTAFWAMCQGDLNRWSQSLVDGAAHLQEDKDWQRQNLLEEMKHFTGFRIARKRTVSSKEVELGIQSSVGGTIVPMYLKLIGTEWKLVD